MLSATGSTAAAATTAWSVAPGGYDLLIGGTAKATTFVFTALVGGQRLHHLGFCNGRRHHRVVAQALSAAAGPAGILNAAAIFQSALAPHDAKRSNHLRSDRGGS